MCMFKTIKIISALLAEGKTGKRLYIAENSDVRFELCGKTKIYFWDGDAWINECIHREQAHWQKKQTCRARRASK